VRDIGHFVYADTALDLIVGKSYFWI